MLRCKFRIYFAVVVDDISSKTVLFGVATGCDFAGFQFDLKFKFNCVLCGFVPRLMLGGNKNHFYFSISQAKAAVLLLFVEFIGRFVDVLSVGGVWFRFLIYFFCEF